MKKKVHFQLKLSEIIRPRGTPRTDATEKADITTPIADPLLLKGTRSVTIAKTTALRIPPKTPVKIRAVNRNENVEARPQRKVPMIKPVITRANKTLLPNLSAIRPKRIPATAPA